MNIGEVNKKVRLSYGYETKSHHYNGHHLYGYPAVHGAMGCGQKSFKLVRRCHQLLPAFQAKRHLLRVSRHSRRSLMIRVIMK